MYILFLHGTAEEEDEDEDEDLISHRQLGPLTEQQHGFLH